MAPGLFSIDLASLTKTADPEAKLRLMSALVNLFIAAHSACSDDERGPLGALMTELIFDLDAETRAAFSAALASCPTAPRELMVKLANDRIAVARTVLIESGALSEDDLAEIAATQSAEHLLALSERPRLPAAAAAAMLRRAPRAAMLRIVRNPGAVLNGACLSALAAVAAKDDGLRAALAERLEEPQALNPAAPTPVRQETAVDESAAKSIDPVLLELDEPHELKDRHVRESDVLAAARARRSSEAIRCLALLSGRTETRIAALFQAGDVDAISAICQTLHFSGMTFEATAELCLHLSEASPHRILATIKRRRAQYR
jgi:hypothetical protein